MAEEIVVPQVGEAVSEVLLVQWFKQEGDSVQKGEPLFEVDTDKVTMDVEAFSDGVLEQILVPDGSDVMPQQVVGMLGDGSSQSVTSSDRQRQEDVESAQQESQAIEPEPSANGRLSPVAQRMASEMGVDLSGQNGSGPNGRVMAEDVRRLAQAQAEASQLGPSRALASPKARRIAGELGVELRGLIGTGVEGLIRVLDVEAASAASTSVDAASAKSTQPSVGQPLSRMRRAIADSTQASKQTVPHFYLTADVEMSAVQSLRRYCVDTLGWAKAPTYTDVLVRASALALAALPGCNVSLIDGQVVQRESVDVGVAVSVADGLFTPVIARADRLSLGEISSALVGVTERARSNRLRPADLSGKSIVLSNLGTYAVDSFIAIIEQPAPMILAVGRISERVVAVAGQPAVRPVCTLTLSADHRVLDGVPAAQFLTRVVQMLEQPFAILGEASQ